MTTLLDTGPGNAWAPEWAPQGRLIACVSDGGRRGAAFVYLVHVETGSVRRLTDSEMPERDPRWSPDGSNLAFIVRESQWSSRVVLFDLRTGVAIQEPAEDPVEAYAIKIEDGNILVGPREGAAPA